MKLGEVKKEESQQQNPEKTGQNPVEIIEESSPEEAAQLLGISVKSPEYQSTVERLRRLKKTDPKLYRKIVNFD